MTLEDWAAGYAEKLLGSVGERWQHARGAADQATAMSQRIAPDDRPVLIAAAFLHDIGYAPALKKTGFHALDGAIHLREIGKERLACLVANHSAAAIEAEEYGLAQVLAEFPDEQSEVSSALTYCDMTVSSDGRPVTINERVADIENRYGQESTVTKAAKAAAEVARSFEVSVTSV